MTHWNDTELAAAFGHRLRRNEPLARHCTLRVGGPADIFLVAHSAEELEQIVGLASVANIPLRVIGSGANILPADAGYRGLVVRNVSRQFTFERDGNIVQVDSGMAWPVTARRTAKLGLHGLEWGCGVPGTVGGVVTNNAGCYGSCAADSLVSVRTVDVTGTRRLRPASTLTFHYRASPFKAQPDGTRELTEYVLSASFRVEPADSVALLQQVDKWLAHRAATQPLDQPSAGSFFKNPPGDFAGRLIEAAGLKGWSIGNAASSEKHANFLINRGNGTATDIANLAEDIRNLVHSRLGVWLEREVEFFGAWDRDVFDNQNRPAELAHS